MVGLICTVIGPSMTKTNFSLLFVHRDIAKVIPHETYDPKIPIGFDILVLKTSKPFMMTNEVQSIQLATPGYFPLGNS